MNRQGLLIVNADDWGGGRAVTDAIERCFESGAISSTTAMVYMEDSRRAAELAREQGRPTGLHLNLTQPFDAADVPAAVRERQRRLCAYFANLRVRRWLWNPDPRVRARVADGIRDQMERYRECYGAEPSHVDSHHHVHVCWDVLFSRALAPGTKVRQTLSPAPAQAPALASTGAPTPGPTRPGAQRPFGGPAGLGRRMKHELLKRRFTTTERLWRATEQYGGYGAVPVAEAAAAARGGRTVEVMVHASTEKVQEALRSGAWLEALQSAPLGPYAALSR